MTETQIRPAPWTSEGVDFLRRVVAGEVYTGMSGESLAYWAVGLSERPKWAPADRADLARCMNVYWSAPESLRPTMQERLTSWAKKLKRPIDFEVPRYFRPWDNLDAYWGTTR